MTNTTQMNGQQRPVKKCELFLVEGGRIRKRWVDSITLHVREPRVARTLKGGKLPDMVVLDTGADQKAESVLEFFYDDMPRLRLEPDKPWSSVRAAATAVGAIVGFQVLLAVFNAVTTAVNN